MRKYFFRPALCAVLSLAAVSAFAQGTPGQPNPPGPQQHMGPPPGPHGGPGHDGGMGGMGGMGFPPAVGAVLHDLHELHRLYAETGREGAMEQVYNDVLNNTQDPIVRHYVRDQLVKLKLKPSNTSQAISIVQEGLKEDLAQVNSHPMPPAGPAPRPAQN